ncbi:MAG TPA: tetratricopeptide repeat protein [Thermoanaerobaculia bacterium]|nr:tetratricopeptide repeat protein [Thermoanaerobaculia bacterium]
MSGRRLFWLVLAASIALTWWSSERAERRLRANLMLSFAERQGSQIAAQSGQMNRQLRPAIASTVQSLRQALPDAPADSRIPLAIGSHYLLLGNATEAAGWYQRGLELEARPEIYLNLGRAALLAGDRDSAIEHFRNALLIDVKLRRSVPQELREEMPPPPKARERG